MRYWAFFAVVLLLMLLVLASGSGNSTPAGPTSYAQAVLASEEDGNRSQAATPALECVIDLDCGLSHYSDLNCSGDFIVRSFFSYSCAEAGTWRAACVNKTVLEFMSWCNPAADEMCIEDELFCQPMMTCHDGALNCHDGGCEEDVDCGGPCEPCPSCYDNIQNCHGNGCERGIDCGGPCPSCEIACANDSDCGIGRYSSPYCGRDGSVYRDYYAYGCVRPGMYGSWCKPVKETIELVDYCGPLNKCVTGECWEQTGHQWDSVRRARGEEPGDVKILCDASGCFKKRVYYNQAQRDLRLQDY